MLLYPNFYCNNAKEIEIELLKKNNIKGILLDVDNTLIDYKHNMLKGIDKWCEDLKKQGIKFCILSNSNNKEKIEKIAKILDIPYVSFGTKPLKRGFKKSKDILNLDYKNMAIIGDQIFTDIIGGNRCNMYTILVEPIESKEMFITAAKRGIENQIIKRYKKSKERKDE